MKNVRHFSDNSHSVSVGERSYSQLNFDQMIKNWTKVVHLKASCILDNLVYFRLISETISCEFNYQGLWAVNKDSSTHSKQSKLKRSHDQTTPTIVDRQAAEKNTISSKSPSLAHSDLQGMISSSLIP